MGVPARDLIREVRGLLHRQLELPSGHQIYFVPGSASGAMESSLWSLIGVHAVDVLAWETFGLRWHEIIRDRLRPQHDVRLLFSGWGELPDLAEVDPARDVVLVVNGTSAGVWLPVLDWLPRSRRGLLIADVSSAAFCLALDWERIDVGCVSFQKALGSEAHFGAVVLGPRALERLGAPAPRPVPRLIDLRLIATTADDPVLTHTPTLLGFADLRHSLAWLASRGGLSFGIESTRRNYQAVSTLVAASAWLEFASVSTSHRSWTPVCLRPTVRRGDIGTFCDNVVALLEKEKIATDIKSYHRAPPGFRLWSGPTVDTESLVLAVKWLEWAVASEFSRGSALEHPA